MKAGKKQKDVLILGGGIAGLSAAYFLQQHNIHITVFDAHSEPGGNCRTIKVNDFLFDTGAHRIHDKDPEITGQIIKLMGSHLKRINAPSKIYDNGQLLSFPLEPQDVFSRMGKRFTLKAGIDLLKNRQNKKRNEDFESFAVNSYGRSMADRFLLNYSKKLWGIPCNELSPEVSGERLKSLTFITLVKNIISKRYAEEAHYEGEFYYPEQGIGQLSQTLSSVIGMGNFRLNSRVTGIFHNNKRIEGIGINGNKRVNAHHFVSTLPIVDFITMMKPAPPQNILDAVKTLKFRNIRLAVFFINNKSINNAATMYFPANRFMFTRGYEPKNRSSSMSPPGMTSFVAEVPCFEHDWAWSADSLDFRKKVEAQILETGLIRKEDIIGCADEKIAHAYPVLEKDYQEKIVKVSDYLSRFDNLEISGRSGLFKYLWIHNLVREGKNIAERVAVGK
jgi:protoporphyrinogen oxidase